MKKYFITYGDDKFENQKKKTILEAIKSNFFDDIEQFGPDNITDSFKIDFKDILSLDRGGGYWIWKYDIILNTLHKMNESDILVYADAGSTINKLGEERFKDYIKMLDNSEYGIISFKMSHLEKKWTTKEIFKYFNVENNLNIIDTGQYTASILIMKKNRNVMNIFNKCLKLLYNNPLLITDYYNNKQDEYFIDNRHDQSITSILRKIHGSIVLPHETWYDRSDKFKYPFWET